MTNLDDRIGGLSPKKRQLLEKLMNAPGTEWQSSGYVEPTSDDEVTLASIWKQVLGVERVGLHDNYFELGGDSIQAIQIVARARRAGLHMTTTDLFDQPTIAGLAGVARRGPALGGESTEPEGPVPLTPIQQWFFDLNVMNPSHWNQAVLLEVAAGTDPQRWGKALANVAERHPAFRLRFEKRVTGWMQRLVPGAAAVCFRDLDLSALDEAAQRAAMEAETGVAQTTLHLALGPLMNVRFFHLGSGNPDRLLIVGHHLVIDGVSFRILIEDLEAAYRNDVVAQSTTSFVAWARRLAQLDQTSEFKSETDYWDEIENCGGDLPVDRQTGDNTEASAATHTVALSSTETSQLVHAALRRHRASINQMLLAGLSEALSSWCGMDWVRVDIEGHGRDPLFDGTDLSRTVGWFTTIYPVRLPLTRTLTPLPRLRAVQNELERVPGRGRGYGILRYLSNTPVRNEVARPDLVFNYLGEFDSTLSASSLLRRAVESCGPFFDPRGHRPYVLQVTSCIVNGRLEMSWNYSQNRHAAATIELLSARLMDVLRGFISGEGSIRPQISDFPEAELSQDELDNLLQ